MFDIGFWELAVIAVVALIVVGPEKFPGMVRTVMSWMRSARALVSDVKNNLEQEVDKANELKKRIAEEARLAEIHQAIDETRSTVAADFKNIETQGTGEHRTTSDNQSTDIKDPDRQASQAASEQSSDDPR